ADFFFEVPLTTNTKNITVQFGTSSNKFMMMLDCIKLEMKAVDIAADGVTTVECEDYAKFFAVSGGELEAGQGAGTFAKVLNKGQASNSQCLYFETGKYTGNSTVAQAAIPVSVTEAGTYIIAITSTSVGSASKLKVVVDGTTYERKSTVSRGNIYENANYPGADFFFEVPLTTNTKNITVQFGTSSNKFMMMLDCVKLKKSAETAISKTTGAATVKYTAAEGPSEAGIAVLALYKDDQLVSVEKWNVVPEVVLNEIVLSYTTEYDGDYDEAKVFVWKDFDKCLPLVVAKDLTIN
ncbi:MAG: hypothetical protein J6Q27_00800, partial [Clostridia bacterium]|nr:hypothetical protein [Clostridia bacterium]